MAPMMREVLDADAVVSAIANADGAMAATAALPAADLIKDLLELLGINGRGKTHVEEIMDLASKSNVEVVALCDPDMNLLKVAAADFEKKYGKKVAIEQDFRKIYEDKNIDAVTLATPNHWHALQTIWACQAGKMYMLKSLPRTTSTRARR